MKRGVRKKSKCKKKKEKDIEKHNMVRNLSDTGSKERRGTEMKNGTMKRRMRRKSKCKMKKRKRY